MGIAERTADGPRARPYERFGLLDTWLRHVLVPSLPESVLTVIAGRDPPGVPWLTAPGWPGLV